MKCEIVGSMLCKLNLHDWEEAADWFDDEHAISVEENMCSRCGLKAYVLTGFETDRIKVLKRASVKPNQVVMTECLHQ